MSAQLVWRGVLNLRLGSLRDPGRVAGWEVVESRPERLVLRATSWHLVATLVFAATEHDAGVTTLLEYRRPVGATLWATVGAVHRHAVPGILLAARRRLEPRRVGAVEDPQG